MSLNRYNLLSSVESGQRSGARLLYISTAKYGGDWLSVPHSHACAELFYVLGGQGNFLIEDQGFPVSKDDLVVVNPRVQHTETSLNAQPLEYIVLGVDGLELTVKGEQRQQYYVCNFARSGTSMQFLLREMLKEIETQAPGHETVCQNLLEVALIFLIRSSRQQAQLVPAACQSSRESSIVRRFIDAHFKEGITLEQLAELVHINKFHMAHRFTQDYGISPINYLLSLRMQESRYLLESTDYSMSQIARIVGFSSSCYFSQAFRKTTGVSPSAYRRSCRNTSGQA